MMNQPRPLTPVVAFHSRVTIPHRLRHSTAVVVFVVGVLGVLLLVLGYELF